MGETKNSSNSGNFGKDTSLENEVKELSAKLDVLENQNAVLEDKVQSYEDPAKKPRVIKRGHFKSDLKFQKNNVKINPTTGEIKNPTTEKPVEIKQ